MLRNKKAKHLLNEARDLIIEAIREELDGNVELMTDEEVDLVLRHTRVMAIVTTHIDSLIEA